MLPILLCCALASTHAYELSVTGGSGGGSYTPSSIVHVAAGPGDDSVATGLGDQPGVWASRRVFDRWTGDTRYLRDEREAHTTLVMPAHDVSITATYRDGPRWLPPSVVTYFPPDGHVGVIFVLHGLKGSTVASIRSVEVARFMDVAIARGYALVFMESFNRLDASWDETESPVDNVDMPRVAAIRDSLVARGDMDATDPVFLLGISNGGKFASLFDQQAAAHLDLPLSATAIYITAPNLDVAARTSIPTLYVIAENDSQLYQDRAKEAYELLLGNDVPTQLWVHTPSPLFAEALARIPALSLADARVIREALWNAGHLDAQGFLVGSPSEADWGSAVPEGFGSERYAIAEQLLVANASHWFMGDLAETVLDFFDSPQTSYVEVPSIVEFSPGSGLPGDRVVIEGRGFFDVSSVSFGGVPASFERDSATRIRTTVPAGAITGPIAVANAAAVARSAGPFVLHTPQIDGIEPASGVSNTLVTVTGSGFVDVDSVTFGGAPGSIVNVAPARITVRVPVAARTGAVVVDARLGRATSPVDFLVVGPSITGMSPEGARPGRAVSVSGENFDELRSVSVGGVPAEVQFSLPSLIWLVVPETARTGPVVITTAAGSTQSAADLVVYHPPQIGGLWPATGTAGTQVLITGENFTGASVVSVGTTLASFVVESDRRIRMTVPEGAPSGRRVWVTTPGGRVASEQSFGG